MPFADEYMAPEGCANTCFQIGLGTEEAAGMLSKSAVQLAAPALGANELKAQAAQPAAADVPGLVTAPAYPGAHTVQAATEPATTPASGHTPGGQGVQLDELAGA